MWIPYTSAVGWARRVTHYVKKPPKESPYIAEAKVMGFMVILEWLDKFINKQDKNAEQTPTEAVITEKKEEDIDKWIRHRQAQARVRFRETE